MHANKGWYLELSQEHYRADKCFDNVTKATRISNTVVCLDGSITKPSLTYGDLLGKAVNDLSSRLEGMSNAHNEANLRDLQREVDATRSFTKRNATQIAVEALFLRMQETEPADTRV